ncbi:hypothetical protein [Brucella anthropi]|nr:hypothetical protein [Brucella anthropi]
MLRKEIVEGGGEAIIYDSATYRRSFHEDRAALSMKRGLFRLASMP